MSLIVIHAKQVMRALLAGEPIEDLIQYIRLELSAELFCVIWTGKTSHAIKHGDYEGTYIRKPSEM